MIYASDSKSMSEQEAVNKQITVMAAHRVRQLIQRGGMFWTYLCNACNSTSLHQMTCTEKPEGAWYAFIEVIKSEERTGPMTHV